jgi:hypothetical protein
MKVYVVTKESYVYKDDWQTYVDEVFSTREAAKAYVDQFHPYEPGKTYDIYSIVEREVNG